MKPPFRILRSELYALVWTKPVTKVAAEIGVSDVAVAKSCRAVGIPLPPRGSWARRQHGHAVRQPRLPVLPGGEDPVIVLQPVDVSDVHPPTPKPPIEPISVPADVRRLHPVLRRLRSLLLRGNTDCFGVLSPTDDMHCPVHVTRQQLDRTCRILQALLVALAARGYQIAEDVATRELAVLVGDDVYSFFVAEQVRRLPIESPERRREHEYADRDWYLPDFVEQRASGALELSLTSTRHRTLKRWFDRAASPLEQRLHEVVADTVRAIPRAQP